MPGVKQPVQAIPVVAPVPSILTVARPLTGIGGSSWQSGIAWQQGCSLSAQNWPLCPPGTTKTLASGAGTVVATEPFVIYAGLECDYPMSETGDELDELARAQVEASSAYGIGSALWIGNGLYTPAADAYYGLPPTLRRNGTDVSSSLGGAAALLDVVAELLWRYEACTYGAGGAVIHLPTILVPGALGGIAGGGRVAWPEGSFYRGPAGSVVSPGPGYPHGHQPDGPNGAGPLLSGTYPNEVYRGNGFNEAWVYVSGPVEYALGEINVLKQPNGAADPFAPNPRQNRYTVVAERLGIVRFDPCCVFAARAQVTIAEVS